MNPVLTFQHPHQSKKAAIQQEDTIQADGSVYAEQAGMEPYEAPSIEVVCVFVEEGVMAVVSTQTNPGPTIIDETNEGEISDEEFIGL